MAHQSPGNLLLLIKAHICLQLNQRAPAATSTSLPLKVKRKQYTSGNQIHTGYTNVSFLPLLNRKKK